ncbi:hypothetical protein TVAG_146980 [Trichomonas vaginalis G3]|uniref:DUF3447 domain-containing protein n=1 Tax=Trichomonas vaginalis (strain ATCC PRA-98 / G3) TaxID=412133 RepID=A2DL01_TRIV3|nr:spectrin binding [Trichomonas vaginalis G3]EAY18954.1 hypothetical protein TVAG_146980 [Trichomonas vaginalis G3]KAI5532020.1 spectrin binding [Trichomonas vaginalis G3]|eukprot:XP_001579940.1 hypothetical protein [Trichomonas vaginalis G3]
MNSYEMLYRLKTNNEAEIKFIYTEFKSAVLESMKYSPKNILKDVSEIVRYNNRFLKSYLTFAKLIYEDYHPRECKGISTLFDYYIYKQYGVILDSEHNYFKNNDSIDISFEVHEENTIYNAIMNDDKEKLITFTEKEEFDKDQKLKSDFYPVSSDRYSLLEICCYHGSANCFKYLRTQFNSEITETCLCFSYLNENSSISKECWKSQKPNKQCMNYAIITHNMNRVIHLAYDYDIEIDLLQCSLHKNLQALFLGLEKNNNISKCFIYASLFNIKLLNIYFMIHGAKVNYKDENGETALHFSAMYGSIETIQFLISKGANVNAIDGNGKTPIHNAAERGDAEIVKFLISSRADTKTKNKHSETALDIAKRKGFSEIEKLLSC